MKTQIFSFACALALAIPLHAASPNVTVTLSTFSSQYSGAGYRVLMTPTTGGTAQADVTSAEGIVTFSSVTPGFYALSILGVGVPTIMLKVPSSSATLEASDLISDGWTLPAPSTSGATPWFRGIAYLWPAAQGAANSALANNGSGTLSWVLYMPPSANLTNWSAIACTTAGMQALLGQVFQATNRNLTVVAAGGAQPPAAGLTNIAGVAALQTLLLTNRNAGVLTQRLTYAYGVLTNVETIAY
jgi:hypothetical protein